MQEINLGFAPGPTHSAEFLSLLRLCLAVQSVTAHVLHKFNSVEPNLDVLILPALNTLNISLVFEDDQNFCLLEKLCLPALEVLTLKSRPDWHDAKLASLIRRSQPPLKVLRVLEGCTSTEIFHCIPHLPFLSSIELGHLDGGLGPVIKLLTPTDGNRPACICPQLADIYLRYYNEDVTPELVVKLILSRTVAGRRPLSRVIALTNVEDAVLAEPRIAECIANGLVFQDARDLDDAWELGVSEANSQEED